MRSVTSCFNSTLYRKNMMRFWPLWALYGLIWLFALPLNLLIQYMDAVRYAVPDGAVIYILDMVNDLPEAVSPGVFLSLFAALFAAMAVFGYLYNNRSACMMHTLPMRREPLFFTQYLSGLSFLMLPLLLTAVLTAAVEMALLPISLWGSAFLSLGIWLVGQSISSFFFYSFAVFCAMFTGNILALPAFYGILNGLVVCVSSLLAGLLSQFYYGYPPTDMLAPELVRFCTPVVALFNASSWYPYGDDGRYTMESWPTLLIFALAGVVLAVLAALVYRHRHVESAGDVVAIAVVRPIFLGGVTFCSGLAFGYFTAYFFGMAERPIPLSISVLAWSGVGWMAAQMLLKKSFRVLHTWKGGLVALALMGCFCATLALDPFGVESRLPTLNQVTSVTLNGRFSYPSDQASSMRVSITAPEEIAQIIALHQEIIQERERADYNSASYRSGDEYSYINLSYQLADGGNFQRNYYSIPLYKSELEQMGTVTNRLSALLENRSLVARAYHFARMEQGRLTEAYLDGIYNATTENWSTLYLDGFAQRLWDAMKQDFDAGTIGVRYLFDNEEQRLQNTYRTDLVFSFERLYDPFDGKQTYSDRLIITLTPHAANTLAVLEEAFAENKLLGHDYVLMTHAAAANVFNRDQGNITEMADTQQTYTTTQP